MLVAALAATSLGGWRLGAARAPGPGTARVVAVIDGDTVDVAWAGRRDRVRLLGVDTPETVDPHRPIGCYGPQAAAFTHRRLEGRSGPPGPRQPAVAVYHLRTGAWWITVSRQVGY